VVGFLAVVEVVREVVVEHVVDQGPGLGLRVSLCDQEPDELVYVHWIRRPFI
jgi:hypothetical protein